MKAPDVGRVILSALVDHTPEFHHDDFWMVCSCGKGWPVDGPYVHDRTAKFARHQAKAVKKALNKAKRTEPEVCPWDCDSCHGYDCPCERLGCEGIKIAK